jgi:hypothetical protein
MSALYWILQMLSMHLPRAAVELKMRVNELDVTILDRNPNAPLDGPLRASPPSPLFPSVPPPVSSDASVLKLKNDLKFTKVCGCIMPFALTVFTFDLYLLPV